MLRYYFKLEDLFFDNENNLERPKEAVCVAMELRRNSIN